MRLFVQRIMVRVLLWEWLQRLNIGNQLFDSSRVGGPAGAKPHGGVGCIGFAPKGNGVGFLQFGQLLILQNGELLIGIRIVQKGNLLFGKSLFDLQRQIYCMTGNLQIELILK